jgi:hypothetical protein
MASVPRPLIALLVGTVAFFVLWTVALKKTSSSTPGGGSQHGVGAYQSAINQAHQAVATANAASAAHGGTVPATPSSAAHPVATAGATSAHAKPSNTPRSTPARGKTRNAVVAAVAARKVVALLFYNPQAADDQAVKQELAAISTHGGRVFKVAVPLSEVTSYTAVTNQVPVSSSPTLVLIDRHQQASTIVGFASGFEIAQRLSDALRGG